MTPTQHDFLVTVLVASYTKYVKWATRTQLVYILPIQEYIQGLAANLGVDINAVLDLYRGETTNH